jgi:hypothetical protein
MIFISNLNRFWSFYHDPNVGVNCLGPLEHGGILRSTVLLELLQSFCLCMGTIKWIASSPTLI